MKLDENRLAELEENGFLILPDWFTAEEVDTIRSRLPALFSGNHPGNIVEQSSGEVRTSMGLHQREPLFDSLARHPGLIEPALQVLREPVYIQQVKVNVKAAFSGEHWQWHYDFATHSREDGVERPQALNLHIFLDEVSEYNGPLYFIPGSHRSGTTDAWLDDESTSYPLWVVEHELVTRLVDENGLVSAKGKRGTALIFHDTLIHASASNISPWDRSIFSVIVNPVANACRNPTRPDFKHHLDFTPVQSLADDCLDAFR